MSHVSEDPTAEFSHESEEKDDEYEYEDTPKKASTTGACAAGA
jgi:hypothetical protein